MVTTLLKLINVLYVKNFCLKDLLEQCDLVLQYHYIFLPLNPSVLTVNSELFTQ
jgi:hypothetical protein